MAVQMKNPLPTILPGKVSDMALRPGEIVPDGQINTELAALETDAHEIIQNAVDAQQTKANDKTGQPDKAQQSDKAQLSEEAKNREISPEQKRLLMLGWTLEQLGTEWLLLLNFMPGAGEDLAFLLDQLYSLFHFLEAAIAENTYGPAQQREMTRLEKAFSAALNRLWMSAMPDITAFFEEFGSKSQVEWLKSGTYFLASGERLPEKQLDRFWQAGRDMQKEGGSTEKGSTENGSAQKGSAQKGSTEKGSTYEAFTRKGTVYQPRGREITFIQEQSVPHSGRLATEEGKTMQGSPLLRTMSSGNPSGVLEPSGKAAASRLTDLRGGGVTSGKPGVFSAQDLQKADGFVKNIVKEGGVFPHSYLNSRHEELLGVLSAITSMKCREFCLTSKMGTAMGSELQAAADRYIDHTIKKSSVGDMDGGEDKQQPLQQKEIYRTYYYTMDQYQKDGKAERAILEGLRYAVDKFQEKKLNALFPQHRYGSETEFFHTGNWSGQGLQGMQPRAAEDLRYGAELLEKDWNNFMKYIGKSHERMASLAAMLRVQKPQGTVLNQAVSETDENTKNYRLFLLVSISVFSLAMVLAWIFFY